jgi:hypothetical protein
MKSPFPGMDPYLEQHWRDIHHRLITYAADRLRTVLPGDLRARIEERVFVESEEGEHREIYPDVRIVEYPGKAAAGVQAEGRVALAEPILVHVEREPSSQGYIEIVDSGSGNRVVTVIEVLSPTNKVPGEGQNLYLKKQQEVIAAGASLVEIDLTRDGTRSLAAPLGLIQPRHRTTYMVCVTRGWKRGMAWIYPITLAQRLPVLSIPLRETDADVPLDLQALIDQCYENGAYDDLDYGRPPVPPLKPDAAAWVDQWLRAQGRRG